MTPRSRLAPLSTASLLQIQVSGKRDVIEARMRKAMIRIDNPQPGTTARSAGYRFIN